ncbi:hypothetical protein [Propylenella binzhouense]|uniref:hypothetical protein n=1 Tax=Propylenella binzhouense TaxID=2555902 RepID=UPI0019672E58|nr:hypothetical protein [Propylenella binzhouense]
MLVYGDHVRTAETRSAIAGLDGAIRAIPATPPGIRRHAAIASAFLDASALAQGIGDAEFAMRGCDGDSPAQHAAMELLLALARALGRSWETTFRSPVPLPFDALRTLAALPLPEAIAGRLAEGYAFYALYPEAYWLAARPLRRVPLRVIGIRSIGTGLAAAVSAAAGAGRPATVRPIGHPYRRALALDPAFSRMLTADGAASFAIVDEGPGLSGSSFGAVADMLETAGVPAERLRFFPSHPGEPGPEAEPRQRDRWRRSARHFLAPEDLLLRSGPERSLPAWFRDVLGDPAGPIEDISGGAWRRLHFGRASDWPAANVTQERRKFLLRTERGRFLLKFVGLGREGERKAGRARALAEAGLGPGFAGFRHGFLAEHWMEGWRPLAQLAVDRRRLVEAVGGYIGFRIRAFPAEDWRGATLQALLEMARHNVGEALGAGAAASLAGAIPRRVRLRRIETDNRMHAQEWLVGPDGGILKADGSDHHAAHDLVGCQDPAWDVAGAVFELAFSAREEADLLAIVARRSGHEIDPPLLDFLKPCYLAFQLGAATMARDVLAAGCPEEAARLEQARARYERLLAGLLSAGAAGGPVKAGQAAAGPSL